MSKIKIFDLTPDKVKCKKEKLHKDLPQPPFTLGAIGPSRSGKSNVIRNMLVRDDLYKNIFQYIFIFCPSLDLNGDFDDLQTNTKTKIIKINSFNQTTIKDVMNQQEEVVKEHGKKKAPHTLLLFDDCVDHPNFMRSNLLKTLCIRGRHMKLSIIISGQKLSLLPTTCRANLTHQMLFRPANFSELDFWLEENIQKSEKKLYSNLFRKIWDTPYSFIYVDYLNPDMNKRFRTGFSTFIKI